MIDSTALQNKKILIPRGKGQAKPFSDLVRQYGGIPVEIPLIAFRTAPRTQELNEILTNLDTYDWVILTSNIAVDTFFDLLGADFEKSKLPQVAVIGAKTKQLLLNRGIPVEFTPSEYVAEGFVRDFLPMVKPGMKIFLPKGNLARQYIANSLTEAGAIVDEAIVYETFAPPESERAIVELLMSQELDILTFTSPSTVNHFFDVVEKYHLYENIEKCLIASIGPVTTKRLLELGMPVHVAPQHYTINDMMDAIIEYLNQVTR